MKKPLQSLSFLLSILILSQSYQQCSAKCCVWNTLNSAVASGRLSPLIDSDYLYAPSQAPTVSCLSDKGFSWVQYNTGECRAVNCATSTDSTSGYVFSVFGGFCSGPSSTVASIQSSLNTFAPSASCHLIDPAEIAGDAPSSGSNSQSAPSPASPSGKASSTAPSPVPAPAPTASSSTCEATCFPPQS